MPPKKRKEVANPKGQRARAAKQRREALERDTAEVEVHRLVTVQSNDTEEDRIVSLHKNAQAHAYARKNETEAQRIKRLTSDAERHATAIANETEAQRAIRLTRNAECHASTIANETEVQRIKRLTCDAERHAAAIANETKAQRAIRLTRDASSHETAISNETESQRAIRLTRDTVSHATALANETGPRRSSRLARVSKSRANETAAATSTRLRNNANYRTNVRVRAIDLSRSLATRPVDENVFEEHYCGLMNVRCTSCNSKNFKDEQTADETGRLQMCCHKGKVKLNPLTPLPDELVKLLKGEGDKVEV